MSMIVKYGEKVNHGGNGHALQQQVSEQLRQIVGPSIDSVTVRWDQEQDEQGKTLYTLRISDATGEAQSSFIAEELTSPSDVRLWLLDLWGDLLQTRSNKLVKRILELVEQGE
jgi:hypothetical protein